MHGPWRKRVIISMFLYLWQPMEASVPMSFQLSDLPGVLGSTLPQEALLTVLLLSCRHGIASKGRGNYTYRRCTIRLRWVRLTRHVPPEDEPRGGGRWAGPHAASCQTQRTHRQAGAPQPLRRSAPVLHAQGAHRDQSVATYSFAAVAPCVTRLERRDRLPRTHRSPHVRGLTRPIPLVCA
jgi:hypothetical protein